MPDDTDRATGSKASFANLPVLAAEVEPMTLCPFCRSAVHEKAIVCPQCHAQRGYYAQKGQITTSAWTVRIVAAILTAVAVGIMLSPLAGTGLGWLALAIVGIPALHNWWALVRGPKWFR